MTFPPNGERGIGLASCILIWKETKANASSLFLDDLIWLFIRIRPAKLEELAVSFFRSSRSNDVCEISKFYFGTHL